MDNQAFEKFMQVIESISLEKMRFRYEGQRNKGYQVVKNALNEAKELASFGERRIALENLIDVLSEVGLVLSMEHINIVDKAFGSSKNEREEILIDFYKKNLVKN